MHLRGEQTISSAAVLVSAGSAAPELGVPSWFAILLAVAGPVLIVLGGFVGHRLARRGSLELDERAKREELLRTIRWAAEHVTKGPDEARVAIAMLGAVGRSALLQEGDQAFIDAIVDAHIAEPVEEYHRVADSAKEDEPDAQ